MKIVNVMFLIFAVFICGTAKSEEEYLEKVRNKFKSFIIYTPDLSKPLISTTVEVNVAPDGLIVGSKITSPSGDKTWDYAVIKAIDGAGYFPKDGNGLIPQQAMTLTFQPFEKSEQDAFLKRAEVARQREIQAKADQDRAATQTRAKQEEQEKNSWYSYKKVLTTYVCDAPRQGESNPGSMLSFAKNYEDPTAHAENEVKEGGQIVAVDIIFPRQNGVIRYVRGKQRCETIIGRLNAQIKNEDEALKKKYK